MHKSTIYIDSNYGIQVSNYALNKSYLFDKNQRLTQLAGPWTLIKAKAVKKTMNGIKEAEGRGLSEICEK